MEHCQGKSHSIGSILILTLELPKLLYNCPCLLEAWRYHAFVNTIGLVMVHWWFAQSQTNPTVILEAAILGSYSALSNLVFRGPRVCLEMTSLMRTTVGMWGQMTAVISGANVISPYTPFWGNSRSPNPQSIPYPGLWARYDIKKIQQIMPDGSLLHFDSLKAMFQLRS